MTVRRWCGIPDPPADSTVGGPSVCFARCSCTCCQPVQLCSTNCLCYEPTGSYAVCRIFSRRSTGEGNQCRQRGSPQSCLLYTSDAADDSSLMGNRIERPLLSRGNTGSSFAKDLGVLVLAFQHLKPTAISWPGRRVVQLAFPHLKPIAATWSERGEGEHIRLGGRRTRRSSLVAARRVAGGSGA